MIFWVNGSDAAQDTCIFCGEPVRENQSAGHWKRDDRTRIVHAQCKPRCAEYGEETVTIGASGFILRPDLKPGDKVKRMSPCWALESDDETICAYHRWLKTAEPGDAWA